MKCPSCGRTIEAEQDLCLYCGARLTRDTGSSISQELDKLDSPKTGDPAEEISRLKRLLKQMDERYASLEQTVNKRLAALEQTGREEASESKPSAAPKASEIHIEGQTAVEAKPSPFRLPEIDVKKATVAATPAYAKAREMQKRKPSEWEAILGGNWLARIGVLALFIGLAFFIMFAIEKGWLGPPTRIILGVLAGLGMIVGGLYWHKRYPTLSQTLSGGGIAVLYLSIFAAFAFFQMLNVYLAIGLLFMISAGSAALALRHNSLPLVLIGIMGAFAAPFVLGVRHPAGAGAPLSGTGSQLLIYIMIVDLGVILVSTFRTWRWLALVAFLGTVLSFGAWQVQYGGGASKLLSEGILTLLFLIFVGATMLFHAVQRKPPQKSDHLLMVVNAAVYAGASYALMWAAQRAWMGGFTVLLALFYAGLGLAVWRRSKENGRLALMASGLALVFLTLAIPVQFGNRAWTTIAWAAEGTMLMWLATRYQELQLRRFSNAVFVLTAVRLCFFDLKVTSYQPVMNSRTLAFVCGIAAMYLTGHLLLRRPKAARDGQAFLNGPAFLLGAYVFSLLLVLFEVLDFRTSSLPSDLPLVLLAIFAALPVSHDLFWRRPLITVDDATLAAVNAAAYLGMSMLVWDKYHGWMGGLYLFLAVCYGVLASFKLKTDRMSILGKYALVIALSFLTLAAYAQLGNQVWTAIAWSIEFALLSWAATRLKIPAMMTFGLMAFALAGVRLLFYDTPVDVGTYTPVLNARGLGFFVAVAAAYLSARIIGRAQKVAAFLLVVANFFTIWVLSHEVWDYFGQQLSSAPTTGDVALRNMQNLSLTALWAFYAIILLAVGISKRLPSLRLGALGLFAIAVAKVFLYDVWALQTIYRVAAFTGLGVLLIVGGYLYQRNSKAIIGFFALKESLSQAGKEEKELK